MKIPYLITGGILFFMGLYLRSKFVIAVGIIFVILSLSEKKENVENKEKPAHKILTSKGKCPDCGAEVFSDDNFCPECGKKILP
ncbi:MAG: zinc ribbon domain-containing protein [Nanoarchaeota archaeon]|nr:zinc ribbon domain-containing protein [Nanoarchaeota archaeon]